MAEIQLPTKNTQDSIKQDTINILSNFPISGGTDFSKQIPKLAGTVFTGESAYTILDVTGSGMLTNLTSTDSISKTVSIVVDGVILGGGKFNINGLLNFGLFIYFSQSLKVMCARSSEAENIKVFYSLE